MDGKCGVCGDPVDGVRKNEAPNGKYFVGIPTHTYTVGSVIDVRVDILAHHMGWFWFKICPVTNHSVEITQECLDQYPLEIVQAPTQPINPYEWMIPGTYTDRVEPKWELPAYRFKLKLPDGLTCDRCVLQWDWKNANRWQWDPPNYGFGYGKQETFRGCADVRIVV